MSVAEPWECEGLPDIVVGEPLGETSEPRPQAAAISRCRRQLLRIADATALAASLVLAVALGNAFCDWIEPNAVAPGLAMQVLLCGCLALALAITEAHAHVTRRMGGSFTREWRIAASGVASGLLLSAVVAPLTEPKWEPSYLDGRLFLTAMPAVLILPVVQSVVRALSHLPGERVLIVGSGSVADAVRRRLLMHRNFTMVGTVDDRDSGAELGPITDLSRVCREERIDRVVVAFSQTASYETVEMLRALDPSVSISVVPRMFDLVNWGSDIEELDGLPLLSVARPHRSVGARFAKRAMDVLVSVALLTVLSPVLLLVAVAIKMDSTGPVLFRQARTGRGGATFRIFKFRTMRSSAEGEREMLAGDNEVDGPIFKIRVDPRVTRVGRVLRKTSIDEIPQLLNVIAGDMSLVGPRPFPVAEASQITDWPVHRTDVRPGITGLWQVSGRNDLSFEDLRYLDSLYVSSWSFWWDIRILVQTPGQVFRRSGAY